MNTPSKLYHYCSMESFYNIVNSKSIWLSNSSQMNDTNENIWIERYFDVVKEQFSDAYYEDFLEKSFQIYRWNSNPPFIFCSSASRDLLSQWRAYSKDASGVSIGFNSKFLNFDWRVPFPNVYADKTIGIAKVEYLQYRQKTNIINICKSINNEIEKSKKNKDVLMPIMQLAFTLVNWALIFKNSSFKEEKEYRIIHTPGSSYEEKMVGLSEKMYRPVKDKIVSYYSYTFGEKFNSNLISEIVLGPKCQMNIDEVTDFLNHHGLGKTRVLDSKSTYR